MVKGLDLFVDYFSAFSDQYLLIGGVACYVAFEDAGVNFRATRDLDIVLCAEALTLPFVQAFWKFIQAGEYKFRGKADGETQFYRFKTPDRDDYPSMLELFSRQPDVFKLEEGQHLTPIPVEEQAVSLSAILLDDDSYDWIIQGKLVLNGVPIVGPEYIIPLKASAWNNLTDSDAAGEQIDGKNIRKHRNDVFRLVAIIDREPLEEVPEKIKNDMRKFLSAMSNETIDFKALGLGKRTKDEVIEILRMKYSL